MEPSARAQFAGVPITWRTLLGVGLLGIAGVLGLWTVVRSGAPVFDTSVVEALHRVNTDWWVSLWRGFSIPTGIIAAQLSAAVGVVVLLVQRRYRTAAASALLGLSVMHVQIWTKRAFERPRPQWDDPFAHAGGFSFPSGHALSAATVSIMVLVVLWPAVSDRWRHFLLVGVLVYALLVGFDRLALGVHYPTDILAGYLTGAACCALVMLCTNAWRDVPKGRHAPLEQSRTSGDDAGF